MYEKETELLDELCTIKYPDVDKIKRLLEEPVDFAYLLGHMIYSHVHEHVWYMIRTHQVQGLLNREVRNTLILLCERINKGESK